VMQQVQHSGAPFIFGACVSQLDMHTMLFPYGSPEWRGWVLDEAAAMLEDAGLGDVDWWVLPDRTDDEE